MNETAAHLSTTINRALPLLRGFTESKASTPLAYGKWSPKEIIGHLIDSAGNNQQKFIRSMEEDGVHFPNYQQDFWVKSQHYNDEPWDLLLLLWEHINLHLAHIVRNIPPYSLAHTITIGNSGSFILEFIAKDYVEHLKHHLKTLFPDADFLANSFKMIY